MDEQTAVELAKTLAQREGRELGHYEQASAELVDGDWLIGFSGTRPLPGNHFLVVIDDRTGAGRIVAGH